MAEPFEETKAQIGMRNAIRNAKSGMPEAEKFLRDCLKGAAEAAPRHALIKMCEFLMSEIYPEAQREAAEQN